jgi:hypothetical protein
MRRQLRWRVTTTTVWTQVTRLGSWLTTGRRSPVVPLETFGGWRWRRTGALSSTREHGLSQRMTGHAKRGTPTPTNPQALQRQGCHHHRQLHRHLQARCVESGHGSHGRDPGSHATHCHPPSPRRSPPTRGAGSAPSTRHSPRRWTTQQHHQWTPAAASVVVLDCQCRCGRCQRRCHWVDGVAAVWARCDHRYRDRLQQARGHLSRR